MPETLEPATRGLWARRSAARSWEFRPCHQAGVRERAAAWGSERILIDRSLSRRVIDPIGPVSVTWTDLVVLALCALAFLVEGYDVQTMALTIPVLAPLWSRSPSDFTFAVSALNVGAVIGSALIAPVGDKFSRRDVVGLLLLANGIFVAGGATAATVPALVIWRFLAGLCLGAAIVNITVVITVRFPRNRRALFLTIASANLSLGGVVGGFAAARITEVMSWRGIFVIGGVAGILVAACLYRSLAHAGGKPPFMDLKLDRRDLPEGTSARHLLSGGLLGVTVPLWIIMFLNTAILFDLLGWLPTMLTSVGWSLAAASRGSAYMQAGGIAGGLLVSWLLDHEWSKPALVTTFLAMIVVFLLFLVTQPSVRLWSILLVLGGGFCLAAHYALSAVAATIYPVRMRATGTGWANAVSRVGSVGGSTIGGVLIHWHITAATIIALLSVPAACCLILLAVLSRGQRTCEDLVISVQGVSPEPKSHA